MTRGKQMKALEEKLADIRHQIAMLQAKEQVLLEIMQGDEPPEKKRAARSNVKQTVLELLEQVKGNGLNASMAVEMAQSEKGIRLERGSVSSLLSRMKNDGLVTYEDGLYRLKQYPRKNPVEQQGAASVHPLRASGDMP